MPSSSFIVQISIPIIAPPSSALAVTPAAAALDALAPIVIASAQTAEQCARRRAEARKDQVADERAAACADESAEAVVFLLAVFGRVTAAAVMVMMVRSALVGVGGVVAAAVGAACRTGVAFVARVGRVG